MVATRSGERPSGVGAQGCQTGRKICDQRERILERGMRVGSRATFPSFDTAQAGALRRSKVGTKGSRRSRQRFSGYPCDYLASLLF